ncbi:SsrA-binding protein SmpB [Candidatus Roizmanbacteria bacterium]|nr:SsrA-binding protein SmpB [Candidatus Roizmanbacteria bacterium]
MKIVNRKFHREYQEIEKYEVGIVLNGAEVKSVRKERLKLEDAFVKILGSEAYLVNAQIPLYEYAQIPGYDLKRSRKLLLHKKELVRLKTKIASGGSLTLVPVSCYNKGGLIKLEIALVKGRKDAEKRRLEKKKDIERQEKREVKEYSRH